MEDDSEEEPVFMQAVECLLPLIGPFQTTTKKVKVLADVVSQKDSGYLERKVTQTHRSKCSWKKRILSLRGLLPKFNAFSGFYNKSMDDREARITTDFRFAIRGISQDSNS